MWYEERINYVDGVLEFRTNPKGQWHECSGERAEIIKKYLMLDFSNQKSIFRTIKNDIERSEKYNKG